MNDTVLRLLLLALFQQFINIIRINVTRYIIKTFFTSGELPLSSWFSLTFIVDVLHSPWKILGLLAIASFTVVTFPLGIWVGSFKLGLSIPIATMVSYGVLLATVPLNLFIIKSWLNEIAFSTNTFIGFVIVEVGQGLAILGWFLISQGQG